MFLQSVSAVPVDHRGSPAWQGVLKCLRIMAYIHEVQISQGYKDVVSWRRLHLSLCKLPVCELWGGG